MNVQTLGRTSVWSLNKLLEDNRRRPVFAGTFGDRMQERWRSLGNVQARGLSNAWLALCSTFNAAMTGALGSRWHVRQEVTGAGKTEALSLWAAMIPRELHHGALLVVRTIHQAETMAKTIKAHNPDASVDLHHSGNSEYAPHRLKPVDMLTAATLIVTHAAYEKGAVEADDPDSTSASLFRAFHRYDASPTGHRRAVVIDESIEFVSFVQVTLDDIEHLLRVVDVPSSDFKEQVNALRRLREFLFAEVELETTARKEGDKLAVTIEHADGSSSTHPYQRFATLWGEQGYLQCDLTPLRRVIDLAPLDYKILRRKAPLEKKALRDELLDILTAAQRTLNNWAFYAREDGRESLGATLYTASVLPGLREIPADKRPSVVVLDATASQSPLYKLFDAVVHPTSGKTRTYRNAELNYAYLEATGKRHLTQHAAEEVPKLLNNLSNAVPDIAHHNVFVLCHKGVAPQMISFQDNLGAKSVKVGSYGNVNGRNDYADCEVGCLFGVFRYSKSWSTAVYFALKGPQGWRWFYSEEGRKIRLDLETGQIATETIQGLNRTSTRRCINSDGDCPPVRLFVTLPNSTQGREILKRIQLAMPGIRLKKWHYSLESIKLRRSDHDAALVAHVGTLPIGKTRASEVRNTLGIPQRSWERFIAGLHRLDSALATQLRELGVTYVVEGVGRGARSYFVREPRRAVK